MRTFIITDLYHGMSGVRVTVKNYRWTKSKGLECEMWPNNWFKSDYNLKEFLAGMAGHFRETTDAHN